VTLRRLWQRLRPCYVHPEDEATMQLLRKALEVDVAAEPCTCRFNPATWVFTRDPDCPVHRPTQLRPEGPAAP
jgi:hypothetical protein